MAKKTAKKIPTPRERQSEKRKINEELFCLHWTIDRNATAAYKRVHPNVTDATARAEASKLLAKPNIQAMIDEIISKIKKEKQIEAADVIEGIKNIVMADIADAFNEDGSLKPIHDIPKGLRLAMSGIEIEELFSGRGDNREMIGYLKKFKLEGKTRNWENLGRSIKLFTDVVENKNDELKNLSDEELKRKTEAAARNILGIKEEK